MTFATADSARKVWQTDGLHGRIFLACSLRIARVCCIQRVTGI